MRFSPLLSIFLVILVDILGVTLILPLLPFYAEKMGATPFIVGSIAATYGLCQLLAGPVLGELSDRIGRKPVLVASQLGTFFSYLLLIFANALPLIFVSRIIDGVTSGNITVAQAYVSDVTQPHERAKAYGMVGVAFSVGFLLGPALSGFLSGYGQHYPIIAAATLSALSIVASLTLLPTPPGAATPASAAAQSSPQHPPRTPRWGVDWRGYRAQFRNPVTASGLYQFLAFSLAFALYFTGFALFAERRFTLDGVPFGPREVGYVFGFAGLVGLICQAGFLGKLVRRFGERRLAAVGFGALAFGILSLSWVEHIVLIHLAVGCISLSNGILRPSLMSLLTQEVERSRQGMMLGLMQSLVSLAQIVAPLASGYLIGRSFLSLWAWLGALLAALGLRLAIRELGRAHAEAPAATPSYPKA